MKKPIYSFEGKRYEPDGAKRHPNVGDVILGAFGGVCGVPLRTSIPYEAIGKRQVLREIKPDAPAQTWWTFKSALGFHPDCFAKTRRLLIDEAVKKYGGPRERWESHPDSKAVEVEIREVK